MFDAFYVLLELVHLPCFIKESHVTVYEGYWSVDFFSCGVFVRPQFESNNDLIAWAGTAFSPFIYWKSFWYIGVLSIFYSIHQRSPLSWEFSFLTMFLIIYLISLLAVNSFKCSTSLWFDFNNLHFQDYVFHLNCLIFFHKVVDHISW